MKKYTLKLFGVFLLVFLVTITSASMLHSRFPLRLSATAIKGPIFATSNRQSNPSQTVVFIQPIFTQAAYGNNDPKHHGFYDYYFKMCSQKCLTVLIPKTFDGSYDTGGAANNILLQKHYSHVTDIDVDKDPSILEKYGTVILLHNEYVTQKEFDAITHHTHVIYLYPNSLFAKIKVDYDKNTITLVRGHWYPNKKIANGFNWKYDNTKFETDTDCAHWSFYDIYNGMMLNCYPEYMISSSPGLLQALTDLVDGNNSTYSKITTL